MIRWRYVLSRLLILALVLVLLGWGLGPAARYVTIKSLESATGAKVEMGHAHVGFFPPSVQYLDVQVADPRSDKQLKNALEADSIELTIDGRAFLQRRWVASEARITGLKIGGQRMTSGHYEKADEPELESSEPSMLGRLVRGAFDSMGDKADAVVADLETVRRGKIIRQRWENDYKRLVAQARELEQQIREIRDSARGIDNPLRDWAELDRTLARATEARKQLSAVRLAIDSLPERLQHDLASMDEAKRIDMAKVDQYVPGDLSQSSNFGLDLMTNAVRSKVQRVREYMDSGRAIANYTVVAPETERVRGVDYDLWGQNRVADMLIRQCELNGLMRAEGKEYNITGILENLTPTPELLVEPTRANLLLEGPETIRVEFIRDRRSGADVEQLTVLWPKTEADTLRLGDDDDASIMIQGGQRELWVQIRTHGDQMQGRFVSKQTGVNMTLAVDEKYSQTPAVVSLSHSLSSVDSIEVDARFAGTWSDMDLNLNTNLGRIFQRAAQDAIEGQMLATKQQLARKIQAAHLKQTSELRNWLSSQQSEARTLLASADKSIEEMSRKVITEIGDADAYLGKLRSAIGGRVR